MQDDRVADPGRGQRWDFENAESIMVLAALESSDGGKPGGAEQPNAIKTGQTPVIRSLAFLILALHNATRR